MYNNLFSIGPFTIHTYGLMTAIGIICAYLLMERFAKKKGLDADRIFWLLIWCLIFGYLGSKTLYFITILPRIIADPSLIRHSLTDGWVMYGGLLGGILGGFLYCRLRKLNAWAYFDIGLIAVVLAQALGRIGCFFAGCCYGSETHSGFCIVFKNSEFAPNNVPLIPTQLLMSAGDFILFFFLLFYDRKKKNEGQVTGAYLTLYSLGRFVIEFFRGDIDRGAVGPLSTSQFIALFVVLFGIIIWIRRTMSSDGLFKKPETEPVTVDEERNEEQAETNSEEKAEDIAEDPSEKIEEEKPAENTEGCTEEKTEENSGEDTEEKAEVNYEEAPEEVPEENSEEDPAQDPEECSLENLEEEPGEDIEETISESETIRKESEI